MCARRRSAKLFATFNVRLSRRELAALSSHWDCDGDGTIDSSEFIVKFFRFKTDGATQLRPVGRALYGAAHGGGWTAAMPPVGRPASTSELFRTLGGSGSALRATTSSGALGPFGGPGCQTAPALPSAMGGGGYGYGTSDW